MWLGAQVVKRPHGTGLRMSPAAVEAGGEAALKRAESGAMIFSLLPALCYALSSTTIAMLYPAFMSFKCIKSGTDTRKWLEYWIVYALYWVVEWTVIDNLVAATWLVFASKLVFIGWMVFYGGASYIYHSKLEAQLVHNEKAIDDGLEKAHDFLLAKFRELWAQGMELVKNHAGSLFQMLAAKNPPPAAAAPPPKAAKPSAKAE
jgi:hypothetical protein